MKQAAENPAKTIDDLRKDPEVIKAEKRLKKAGFSNAWCDGLLEQILNLPYQFEIANRETRSEAVSRRSKLARKMKKLAGEMDQDIDLKNFIPVTRGGRDNRQCFLLIASPENGLPSLGSWVQDCAEHLEELSASGKDNRTRKMKKLVGELSSRSGFSLKSFVVHGVYGWIDYYLVRGRELEKERLASGKDGRTRKMNPAKNICTASLAGAVLGIKVTAEQVSKIRENERRPYSDEK